MRKITKTTIVMGKCSNDLAQVRKTAHERQKKELYKICNKSFIWLKSHICNWFVDIRKITVVTLVEKNSTTRYFCPITWEICMKLQMNVTKRDKCSKICEKKTHISSTLDTTTTNLPKGAKTDAKKKWLMISPSLWSNLSLWPYGPVVPKVYSAILPSPSTGILYVMHLFVVLYFILRQLCFLVGRHKKWTRGKNCQMSPQS